MTDDQTQQTSTDVQDDDEEQQLESGDDLAAKALQQSSIQALPQPRMIPAGSAQVGESLISLQNIIERNADELDLLKEELKQYRESLKNLFENDTELAEVQEQATQATQKIKEKKTKIQASPEAMQLKAHMSELTDRKKEIEEALNNHLLNLYQITGTRSFDTSSGKQREFSIRASLKSSKVAEAA